uniref:Putative DNA ligase domain protein n=1 Tax=viral metagenome TaxID=1070528 RepID=A0A6M3K040_9ZZZZ
MPKRSGIMLCYPFEEKRLEKWEPPYLVQPKLDGERCRAIVGGATPSSYLRLLLSSEQNIIESVPHINEALDKLDFLDELDGELYIHGASFEEIHSIVGRTVNIHPDYKSMEFHIFDKVDPEASQVKRISDLAKHSHYFKPPLIVVPTYTANNLDEIMSIYDRICNMGYEGIIVRHLMAPYIRRRSLYMLKFKPKKDDWYKVIGYKEEVDKDGNPKDRLGALVCVGNDETVFSVGSGLTEDDRRALWNSRETLKGKLCHVQYQHLTSGKGVPRFPVFVEVIEAGKEVGLEI